MGKIGLFIDLLGLVYNIAPGVYQESPAALGSYVEGQN
jgi:hypothetical protein